MHQQLADELTHLGAGQSDCHALVPVRRSRWRAMARKPMRRRGADPGPAAGCTEGRKGRAGESSTLAGDLTRHGGAAPPRARWRD